MTPEDPPDRGFDDDPAFLARLAELDRGVSGPDDEAPQPADSRPTGLGPAPRVVRPPLPPLTFRPGERPLLDIFPPSATTGAEPMTGANEGAPPLKFAPQRPSEMSRLGRLQPTTAPGSAQRDSFFGFDEPPFTLSTDPKFLYHSNAHDAVAQEMLHAIGQRHGLVLLTGDIGLGKTITCRAVLDQLDHRTLTSLVGAPFESTELLLRTVLVDFGVVSRADAAGERLALASTAALSVALRDFLHTLTRLDAFAVVVVDEAQNLPDEALELLRRLTDSGEGHSLLQVVLVGGPMLRDRLARPGLKALADRITVRCTHRRLDAEEVPLYVAHRLHVATSAPTVTFDDEALERLQALSLGVPRAINLLCERALGHARTLEARVIGAALIDRAAAELGLREPPPAMTGARGLLAALLLLVLVAIGAAAAAYIFRSELSALFDAWATT